MKTRKPETKGEEILMEIGQEDEKKAAKAVTEVMSETQGQEKYYRDMLLNRTAEYSKNKPKYLQWLQQVLFHNLKRVDWGYGWTYRVSVTDKGILLEVFDYRMKRHVKGFTPVGDAEVDLFAIDLFVIVTENTVDKVEKRDGQGNSPTGEIPTSNIILPS